MDVVAVVGSGVPIAGLPDALLSAGLHAFTTEDAARAAGITPRQRQARPRRGVRHEGDPSWVFVTATGVDGPLRVEVEGKTATVTGTASLVDGTWSWGGALPFPLPDIKEVRVVRGDGAVVLHLAR